MGQTVSITQMFICGLKKPRSHKTKFSSNYILDKSHKCSELSANWKWFWATYFCS